MPRRSNGGDIEGQVNMQYKRNILDVYYLAHRPRHTWNLCETEYMSFNVIANGTQSI